MKIKHFFPFFLCFLVYQHVVAQKEISVLQFNIWQEGTVVENGFEGIVDNIAHLEPDFITLSEVRNYNQTDFISSLIQMLKKKGLTYYGEKSVSTGILSKYPIVEQTVIYPLHEDRGSVLKASFMVGKQKISLYSAHLDWKNCSYYLPRGYGSSDWKKLSVPILHPDTLLVDNRASFRDDAIRDLISDAKKESDAILLIGGDFNEPSHIDWQADTKSMRDHRGVVINWDCSMLLYANGFHDCFREKYPNTVTHPGFTFPADNPEVDLKRLVWAPDADERERIDFIYYQPHPSIHLKDVRIVGPSGSILCGKRMPNDSEDAFLDYVGVWPTDHKAIFASFILENDNINETCHIKNH